MIRNELVRLIGTHALWRSDLLKAARARHFGMDVTQVLDDANCDLGQCLQNFVEPQIGDLLTHSRQAHLVFHAIAAQIVQLIAQDRIEDADLLLRKDGPFMQASAELVHDLNQIVERIPPLPNGMVPEYQSIQKLKGS